MIYILKNNEGYYYVKENEMTKDKTRARWFDYKKAKKKKADMNRKTNPRLVWEVVEK